MLCVKGSKISLLVALACLTISGCATSTNFNSQPDIYLPPLPANVLAAGGFTKMPKGPAEARQLILTIVQNERKNARAIRSLKAWYAKVQRIYNQKRRRR